jgi:hypothetical protein
MARRSCPRLRLRLHRITATTITGKPPHSRLRSSRSGSRMATKPPLPRPTDELVRAAVADFDADNQLVEKAAGEIFAQFPHNTEVSHVLLKALALTSFTVRESSTRISNLLPATSPASASTLHCRRVDPTQLTASRTAAVCGCIFLLQANTVAGTIPRLTRSTTPTWRSASGNIAGNQNQIGS